MELISKARKTLQEFLKIIAYEPTLTPTRVQVVAYATLEAFTTHFAQNAKGADTVLLSATKIIFEKEPDRFFKQRRIALALLAQTLQRESTRELA